MNKIHYFFIDIPKEYIQQFILEYLTCVTEPVIIKEFYECKYFEGRYVAILNDLNLNYDEIDFIVDWCRNNNIHCECNIEEGSLTNLLSTTGKSILE